MVNTTESELYLNMLSVLTRALEDAQNECDRWRSIAQARQRCIEMLEGKSEGNNA